MPPQIRIVRLTHLTPAATHLLAEYYAALDVVQRDTPESLANVLAHPSSGLWLAFLDATPVGCVLLRALPAMPHAAECKRLYVQPAARGRRIAHHLLDALEAFARTQSLRAIYLDSHDGLTAALTLYRTRGYLPCERYNDNPQATVFLRKSLAPPTVVCLER